MIQIIFKENVSCLISQYLYQQIVDCKKWIWNDKKKIKMIEWIFKKGNISERNLYEINS